MSNSKKIIIVVTVFVLAVIAGIAVSVNVFKEPEPKENSSNVIVVPTSGEMPVLSMEQKEVSLSSSDYQNNGEIVVPIEFSVSGIKNGWANMGIHIAFDNRLEPKLNQSEEPQFNRGEASEHIGAMLTSLWKGEPPEQLQGKNMDNLFICATSSSNSGTNGVIAEFEFTLPDDAKPGDIYKFEFFYNEMYDKNGKLLVRDCFTNIEQDKEMENYAFASWEEGYIKITE